jgi:hypothetical protein
MSGYSEDLRRRIVSLPTSPRGLLKKLSARSRTCCAKVAARSKEALEEAMGLALLAVSSEDTRGYFEHAGYRHTGHLL